MGDRFCVRRDCDSRAVLVEEHFLIEKNGYWLVPVCSVHAIYNGDGHDLTTRSRPVRAG